MRLVSRKPRSTVKSPSSDRDRGVVGILNNSWDLIGEMMDASHEKKPRRSITAHIWVEVDGVWYRQFPSQKIAITGKGTGLWTPYPISNGQVPMRVYQPEGWKGPDYAWDGGWY